MKNGTSNVKIGQYLIKNVPHQFIEKKSGLKKVRSNEVEDKVADIFAYMEEEEINTYNFREWKK